jgi:hypothetical protein
MVKSKSFKEKPGIFGRRLPILCIIFLKAEHFPALIKKQATARAFLAWLFLFFKTASSDKD